MSGSGLNTFPTFYRESDKTTLYTRCLVLYPKQWHLKAGDQLAWSLESIAENVEVVTVVRRAASHFNAPLYEL